MYSIFVNLLVLCKKKSLAFYCYYHFSFIYVYLFFYAHITEFVLCRSQVFYARQLDNQFRKITRVVSSIRYFVKFPS